MIPIELGPLAAFDAHNGTIVVFEEHRSLLVSIRSSDMSRTVYALPPEYKATQVYWASIHCVHGDTILCLLKSHVTRVYYLVTLRLDKETKRAVKTYSIKTNIHSHGYRIQSHRAGSQFVFSISNAEKTAPTTLKKSVSDRRLFRQQVLDEATAHSRSTPTSPTERNDVERETERIFRRDTIENHGNLKEGVMLVAFCNGSGEIQASVVSLGKARLGVKLRRVGSIRRLKHAIGTKFMTRLSSDSEELLCEPVLCGGRALLLSRSDASVCCLADTVTNPSHGIAASIQHKINDGMVFSSGDSEMIRVPISSLPPDSSHLWSNIEIVDGILILLTVAPSTGFSQLFFLHQLAGPVPRLFWKRQEISLSIASRSLIQTVIRIEKPRDSARCLLSIRALLNENETAKSYIEHIEFRM